MAIKGFNSDQFMKTMIFGLVFLAIITSIVNFSAIGKDACSFKAGATATCAEIVTEQTCLAAGCQWNSILIEPEGGYESVVSDGFLWLVVGMALLIGWSIATTAGSAWNKKALVTFALVGVSLYFLYTLVLNPLMPNVFPDLAQTAYRLQALSPQGIQSIFGAP